jgi:hypothetical protein
MNGQTKSMDNWTKTYSSIAHCVFKRYMAFIKNQLGTYNYLNKVTAKAVVFRYL